MLCESFQPFSLPGLGLATEWIEIKNDDALSRYSSSLGLATEWIEIYPQLKLLAEKASRSYDRVD